MSKHLGGIKGSKYKTLLFLTFSALVANPEKATLHGGQSHSWSAEQGGGEVCNIARATYCNPSSAVQKYGYVVYRIEEVLVKTVPRDEPAAIAWSSTGIETAHITNQQNSPRPLI